MQGRRWRLQLGATQELGVAGRSPEGPSYLWGCSSLRGRCGDGSTDGCGGRYGIERAVARGFADEARRR